MNLRKVRITSNGVLLICIQFVLIFAISIIYVKSQKNHLSLYIISAILEFFLCCIISVKNFERHFPIICFNLMYFIFLISGMMVNLFDESYIYKYLRASTEAARHTCYVIFLAIAVVNITYTYLANRRTSSVINFESNVKINVFKNRTYISLIRLGLIICIPCKIVSAVARYALSVEMGYSGSYLTEVGLPFIIYVPATMYLFFFCMWLTTNPSKKEFILLTSLALFPQAIVLFAGDRGEPMSLLMMIVFYCVTFRANDKDFFRINKKSLFLMVVIAVALMCLLQYVGLSRDNREIDETSGLLSGFFESQGISATVLSTGYDLRQKMQDIGGRHFAVGTVVTYLTQNFLVRRIFGIEAIKMNTVEAATSGNSFGSTLAYLRYPTSYLSGVGGGSSFVAELYNDGGYFGVIVGSALIACIFYMLFCDSRKKRNLIPDCFVLLMFMNIVMVPRDSMFKWLSASFSVQNLIFFFMLSMIEQILVKRK